MAALTDVHAAGTLAECRRAGTLSRLPLHAIATRAEAEAFQAAAVRAFGGEPCGHKIGATSVEVQRLLQCEQPIHAPLLRQHVLPSGTIFAVPEGLLGVECEFGFRMASDFPMSADGSNMAALRSSIAECFAALELVGRRVASDIPLNEASSIADFALDVAVVRGEPIEGWEQRDLAQMPVRAVLDGVSVASGSGAMVLGHPLNALLWLAEALRRRGDRLRSGEIILTGTCTGVTKVAPGQSFSGCFADRPPVAIDFA